MITAASSIEKQVKEFCALIGADPLLVQGAGGNISWKDSGILWVKASGAWLADAKKKEIFTPVDQVKLKCLFDKNGYDIDVASAALNNNGLRPSIETLLHVLMPQKIVIHLHSVEIISYMVKSDPRRTIERFVWGDIEWIFIDYHKPGVDLARAVFKALEAKPHANVVFLENHGVVVGAESINGAWFILKKLINLFKSKPLSYCGMPCGYKNKEIFKKNGYTPCVERKAEMLVSNHEIAIRLHKIWALYPDHIVFLGGVPAIFDEKIGSPNIDSIARKRPPFIFSINEGVYQRTDVNEAELAQLTCYCDVLLRQKNLDGLSVLNIEEIKSLTNWESEVYRQGLQVL